MKKVYLIVSIVLFLLVTFMGLLVDDGLSSKRVDISAHQSLNIKASKTLINNTSSRVSSKSSSFTNSSADISSKKLSLENHPSLLKTDGKISHKSQAIKSKSKKSTRYAYKDIDWREWKSSFINRITDDSFDIEELEKYPKGTMFYYSFYVTDKGDIQNVQIHSIGLSKSTKLKISEMIKGYNQEEITVFPANSNRKKVKVSAIMILSDKTDYATPHDFHDFEHAKYKLTN